MTADPMNQTSTVQTLADDVTIGATPEIKTDEPWPHNGGFALTNADIDEVRRRAAE